MKQLKEELGQSATIEGLREGRARSLGAFTSQKVFIFMVNRGRNQETGRNHLKVNYHTEISSYF